MRSTKIIAYAIAAKAIVETRIITSHGRSLSLRNFSNLSAAAARGVEISHQSKTDIDADGCGVVTHYDADTLQKAAEGTQLTGHIGKRGLRTLLCTEDVNALAGTPGSIEALITVCNDVCVSTPMDVEDYIVEFVQTNGKQQFSLVESAYVSVGYSLATDYSRAHDCYTNVEHISCGSAFVINNYPMGAKPAIHAETVLNVGRGLDDGLDTATVYEEALGIDDNVNVSSFHVGQDFDSMVHNELTVSCGLFREIYDTVSKIICKYESSASLIDCFRELVNFRDGGALMFLYQTAVAFCRNVKNFEKNVTRLVEVWASKSIAGILAVFGAIRQRRMNKNYCLPFTRETLRSALSKGETKLSGVALTCTLLAGRLFPCEVLDVSGSCHVGWIGKSHFRKGVARELFMPMNNVGIGTFSSYTSPYAINSPRPTRLRYQSVKGSLERIVWTIADYWHQAGSISPVGEGYVIPCIDSSTSELLRAKALLDTVNEALGDERPARPRDVEAGEEDSYPDFDNLHVGASFKDFEFEDLDEEDRSDLQSFYYDHLADGSEDSNERFAVKDLLPKGDSPEKISYTIFSDYSDDEIEYLDSHDGEDPDAWLQDTSEHDDSDDDDSGDEDK